MTSMYKGHGGGQGKGAFDTVLKVSSSSAKL